MTIEQLIEETKQHYADGLITRKEMLRKIAELKAKIGE